MGASLEYYFWFAVDKAMGKSILQNPMELFGLGLLLIAFVVLILLLIPVYKSYKQSEQRSTLYFFLAIFCNLIGAVFLIGEKFSYSSIGDVALGDIFSVFALNVAGVGILFLVLFAFENSYPERVPLFGTIVGIVLFTYTWTLCWAILTGPPVMDIVNFEIEYKEFWINILIYVTAIPIMLIAPITFFIFAKKTRTENSQASKRAFWFGMGTLFYAIGYTVEIAPFFPTVLSIPLRSFLTGAAILLYLTFTLPEWFKKATGIE